MEPAPRLQVPPTDRRLRLPTMRRREIAAHQVAEVRATIDDERPDIADQAHTHIEIDIDNRDLPEDTA
jgi:hypothetical protein